MKISKVEKKTSITMKTTDKKDVKQAFMWWKADTKEERAMQMLSTAAYLKESQNWRQRQAAIYARLYGNLSLYSFIGSNISKMDSTQGLPIDRPTFNLVQSAVDTLVSRIAQSRPQPVFLTDNSDYKERSLAKKLNNFIQGEFFQTKAYEKATIILRDALVEGTGILKVYETADGKVGLERKLLTEILTDPNEGIYGDPRQIYEVKLMDRSVLMDAFPEATSKLKQAEMAYPDNSADSSKTVADLIMVVEGWRLPSGKDSGDGRHTIACTAGSIIDEEWTKDKFPFIFLHYSPRMLGFWAQGLAEQLMGTQLEINALLYTISKSIKLVGVPRVFVEDGSKVVKAHLNNDVGAIVTYRGTKPEYEVAPCVPAELYEQLQRLINYGYQQCGVSSMQAGGEKPAGLDSGEAQRVYDDIATDRFATLNRRYDNFFIDLAYAVIDTAKDIAERDGEYQTVYPNKNGTKQIDLPKAELLKNPFVIQCFNQSSLPRDPAGRMAKITEMIQSGMITVKEGRRLLDYPDLDQVEKLANASEERILQCLDAIVEDGEFTPPDPFMDLVLGNDLTVQYINLYSSCKLEEAKMDLLRKFFLQIQDLKNAANPQPAPGGGTPQPAPQAAPEAAKTSPLVPNSPNPQQ